MSTFTDEQINAVMRLSPQLRMETSFPVNYLIEMCIKGNAGYKGCGTPAAHSKWFVANAEVNIARMEKALEDLDRLPRVDELDQVVRYERVLQHFYIDVNKARLQFYLREDSSVLEKPIGGIDPRTQCSNSLEKVQSAASRDAANALVLMGWYNCMNANLSVEVGPYPVAAWRSFLRKARIEEVYVPRDDD